MSGAGFRIAVIGGTGALGSALARRWARAGYVVLLGSRDPAKAASAATALARSIGSTAIAGLTREEAARAADLVVVSVPYPGHAEALAAIRPAVAGKIVLDTTVPLVPPRIGTAQMPADGCAALEARRILGEEATVVSAFHTVSAERLARDEPDAGDVLVFGDKRAAREVVIRLVEALGLHALHGGQLANSVAAEAMTSVLITINRLYKVKGSGIRIVGLEAGGGPR